MSLSYYVNWSNAHKARKTRGFSEGGFVGAELPDLPQVGSSLVNRKTSKNITQETVSKSVGQKYMDIFAKANEEYLVADSGNRVVTRDPNIKVPSSALSDEALQDEMVAMLSSGNTKRDNKGLDVRAKFDEMGHLMMNRYTKELGLTSFQAAALTGNAYHETGGFKYMDEQNPKVKGSAGGINLFQFTGLKKGLRRSNFEKFAAAEGLDPRDYKTGLTFSIYELTKGDQKNVLRMLRKTKTAEEANQIIVEEYLRPDPKTMKMKERQRLTNEYANSYTTPEDFETNDISIR